MTEKDAGNIDWYLDGFSLTQDTPLGATKPSTTAPSRPRSLDMPHELPPLLGLSRGVRIFRGSPAWGDCGSSPPIRGCGRALRDVQPT